MNLQSWTVVAQDPSVASSDGSILKRQVRITPERLSPGPQGPRVQVIDYDSTTRRYRPPLKDTDPMGIFQDPTDEQILEHPGFRAHNCYAIAMSTLRVFEEALGRRVSWAGDAHQLKIAPHAFATSNAFYSREAEALLFGYFRGENGPVFSSLSHDVIVHETTHALLDGLRSRFAGPSQPDQAAFHEGLADVVALLSVLSDRGLVARILDLQASQVPGLEGNGPDEMPAQIPKEFLKNEEFKTSVLFGLASQMGEEMSGVRGQALRRSIEELGPEQVDLDAEEFQLPHRRGEILVSIVMHAFIEIWIARLTRLAGNGTTVASEWVAEEASDIARELLGLIVRALDYTPPVNIEFGDYLSALMTADHETRPDDGRYHFQAHLLAMFARFGIEPAAGSENSGRWLPPRERIDYELTRFESLQRDPDEAFRFIWANAEAIGLRDIAHTRVLSVRPCFRRTPQDGLNVRETVVECLQLLTLRASELGLADLRKPPGVANDAEVLLQGGVTLIFDERGNLKMAVRKPLHPGKSSDNRRAHQHRLNRLAEHGWFGPERETTGIAHIHQARATSALSWVGAPYQEERWT